MTVAMQSLHYRTLTLLQDRPRRVTYTEISDKIKGTIGECGISADWLQRFATGRCDNVDVDRVQILYQHLKGETLIVA